MIESPIVWLIGTVLCSVIATGGTIYLSNRKSHEVRSANLATSKGKELELFFNDVARLREENAQLRANNGDLLADVADLRARLKLAEQELDLVHSEVERLKTELREVQDRQNGAKG